MSINQISIVLIASSETRIGLLRTLLLLTQFKEFVKFLAAALGYSHHARTYILQYAAISLQFVIEFESFLRQPLFRHDGIG